MSGNGLQADPFVSSWRQETRTLTDVAISMQDTLPRSLSDLSSRNPGRKGSIQKSAVSQVYDCVGRLEGWPAHVRSADLGAPSVHSYLMCDTPAVRGRCSALISSDEDSGLNNVGDRPCFGFFKDSLLSACWW